MINIIYEDNHILVVEKPRNIPVQADDSKDEDLLNILKKYIKDKYKKSGNVYLGLVHRLDRPVGGIMVFAKTSKAASRLSDQIRKNEFTKKYYAVIDGVITTKSGILKDKLVKNHKTNMTEVNESGKEAILSYNLVQIKNNLSLVDIELKTGRSHQIRVQFASRGHPLYGDQRYNSSACKEPIALYAYSLSFKHPVLKQVLTFTLDKPDIYPFSLF